MPGPDGLKLPPNIQIEIKGDTSELADALTRMSHEINERLAPAMRNLGTTMAAAATSFAPLARAIREAELVQDMAVRARAMETRPLLIMPRPEVIQRNTADTLPLVAFPDIGEITEPAEPVDENAPARVFRPTDEND